MSSYFVAGRGGGGGGSGGIGGASGGESGGLIGSHRLLPIKISEACKKRIVHDFCLAVTMAVATRVVEMMVVSFVAQSH